MPGLNVRKAGSTFSLSLDVATLVPGSVIYFEHEALDQWVTEFKNKGLKFDQDPADQSYYMTRQETK